MTAAAAHALPRPRSAATRRYLDLLDARFAALEQAAAGRPLAGGALGLSAADAQAARRVLRPLEAEWHDGDENLVRGMLDRWMPPGTDAPREVARRLLAAGDELAHMDARKQAWWFYLWELESLLALVGPEGGC